MQVRILLSRRVSLAHAKLSFLNSFLFSLSCVGFNVMYSFSYPNDFANGELGPFLAVVSMIAIAIYFMTSSDAGSLMVDHLASNGHEEHHWLQRLFWALTEGAVASALLVSGGAQSLQALQAAAICTGLPFTVLLLYMLSSIYTMSDMAEKGVELLEEEANEFATRKIWITVCSVFLMPHFTLPRLFLFSRIRRHLQCF